MLSSDEWPQRAEGEVDIGVGLVHRTRPAAASVAENDHTSL